MKAVQRRALWQNGLFSALISAGIIAVILVRRELTTSLLAILLAVYVLGNAVLHIKHNSFNREVLLEYVLLSFAVFVVLASAILR